MEGLFVAKTLQADLEYRMLLPYKKFASVVSRIDQFESILKSDPYHIFEADVIDQHDLKRDLAGFTALRVSPQLRFVYRVLSVSEFKSVAPRKLVQRMRGVGLLSYPYDALVLWIRDTALAYHFMSFNSTRNHIEDSLYV